MAKPTKIQRPAKPKPAIVPYPRGYKDIPKRPSAPSGKKRRPDGQAGTLICFAISFRLMD